MNLKTAMGRTKNIEDFELQSLRLWAGHSQRVKAALKERDCSSKDYAFWPALIAVFRLKANTRAARDDTGVLPNV